ncbi:MAG: cell division topological specificity factor MinE [Pseudomonadota bacterium]
MLMNLFRRSRSASSASMAKDRLQILLAHERAGRSSPEVLPLLQRDIMAAIERHMKVGSENVDIRIERGDDLSTLEINIELPGTRSAKPVAALS